MAIACGLIWGVLSSLVNFLYLNLLLAAGAGYAIGEVVSLSVNRKRGTILVLIASLAVVVSYLVSIFSPWGSPFIQFDLLRLILDLLAVALGIFIAVTRLR